MIITSLLFSFPGTAVEHGKDWRKSGTADEKLANVVKVIPSTSDIMFQMGERYKNLYWAAKQGKWEFARYQVEEMQSLINKLMITRPKRAATAKDFMEIAFKDFEDAIEKKNWPRFQDAYTNMRDHCIQCHVKNEHAFIVLRVPPPKGSSPVLD